MLIFVFIQSSDVNVEQHRPQIKTTLPSMLQVMLFSLPLSYVFKARLPPPSHASSWLAHQGLHLHLDITSTKKKKKKSGLII